MSRPASEATAPHVGTVLGDRYELVRHIARGGMGDVYEAQDRLLQRPAAVKLYRAASPADRARFDDEVRILAGLNHPGLVRVYDAGSHGEDAFLVLELIDGPPLSASMEAGRALPPERVAALGAELADALAYIHGRGVVHRDLTPANVLCGPDGRPRLVDFGIVRLLDSPRVTSASITLGTPAYMAPEQVEGRDVTPAADVYSLGLVLLELLTGRHEFVGSVQEVAMARLVRDPDTTTGVPSSWRPLLHRACQRDPAQRPSATELGSRLTLLAGITDPDTAPVPLADGSAEALATVAMARDLGDGGTTVLPVAAPLAFADPPLRRRAPRWAVGAAAAATVVAVIALTAAAGSDSPPTSPTSTSTTTAPAAATAGERATASSTTHAPTTTSPTTTVAPRTDATSPPTTEATPATTPTTLAPTTTAVTVPATTPAP